MTAGEGGEDGSKEPNCTAELYNQAGCITGIVVFLYLLSGCYMTGQSCMAMVYIAECPLQRGRGHRPEGRIQRWLYQ